MRLKLKRKVHTYMKYNPYIIYYWEMLNAVIKYCILKKKNIDISRDNLNSKYEQIYIINSFSGLDFVNQK